MINKNDYKAWTIYASNEAIINELDRLQRINDNSFKFEMIKDEIIERSLNS